jgi:hypothetical protein
VVVAEITPSIKNLPIALPFAPPVRQMVTPVSAGAVDLTAKSSTEPRVEGLAKRLVFLAFLPPTEASYSYSAGMASAKSLIY